MRQEILIVLPYKQSGSQGNEIKLTLSAWKKFCKFDYHFIVIGEFDNKLKIEFPWVEFIYIPKIFDFPEASTFICSMKFRLSLLNTLTFPILLLL